MRYYDANVGGTANLLDALAASGSESPRFVLASTNNVYGTRDGSLSEDLELHPESPYAASKVAAEQLVTYQAATGALAATVLRLFNVAGAIDGITDTDTRRLIPGVLAVAAGERPTFAVNGDGGAVREYTHVRDAAAAVVVALTGGETGKTRCYNVGTGRGVSVLDEAPRHRRTPSAVSEVRDLDLGCPNRAGQLAPRESARHGSEVTLRHSLATTE